MELKKVTGVKRETIVQDLKQKQLIMRYIHRTLEAEFNETFDESAKGLIAWKIGKCRYFWSEINDQLDEVMNGSLAKNKKYKVAIGISQIVPEEDTAFDKPHYDKEGNKLSTDPYKENKIENIIKNLGALRSLLFTARTREWEKDFSINLSFWQKSARNMKEYAESLDENSFYKFSPVTIVTV